jgi:predicted DNA-binding transcriptional regulator AlpA
MEEMIKIKKAAELIGVAERTIYNWLSTGILKLAHPGYVRMSEVEVAAKVAKMNQRYRATSKLDKFNRDEKGRFRLLSGELNNKNGKDLL